jgi:hypothetical protein
MGLRKLRMASPRRAWLVVLAVALFAADAVAIPVLWNLSGDSDSGGIRFDDDGDLNGSFIYDADRNRYSAVSLKTTAGSRSSPFFGATYASAVPASSAEALTATAIDTLLAFSGSLTNQGGRLDLDAGSETLTSGVDSGALRSLVGGEVVGVPVPEPSTASLVALGLSALAAGRRFHRMPG